MMTVYDSSKQMTDNASVYALILQICFCVCLLVTDAQGKVYDAQRLEDVPGAGPTLFKLRLNIPASVPVVRGLLINGNYIYGDLTETATDPELVAFAESIGFAVLATGNWFALRNEQEVLWLEEMLQELTDASGHPEVIHAPWLPMGPSNGGQMSYDFNYWRPWKVIGFITSKGTNYASSWPKTEALKTPGMIIAGQNDTQESRASNKALFDNNRPRGALWAWVEEEGVGHDEADSKELKITFLAECVRLRYPADQSPLEGPVRLKDLHEFDGWLVDQTTWETGLTAIYPYDEAPGDERAYGWVPSEKIARYYQAFSSYNKASVTVGGSARVTDSPASLTYELDLLPAPPEDPISMIEFFQNGVKVGESVPAAGLPRSITVEQREGGFQVFSAIVTYASGVRRATHLRRVFVRGERPLTPYERWALENLPDDQRDPWQTLFDDSVFNLERFAYGLGVTEPYPGFQALRPADPFTEDIEGVDHVVYTYEVNQTATQAGLNIMPQVTADKMNWVNVTNVDDPRAKEHVIVYREGDLVTIKYPHSTDPLDFSVQVSDTYEGVDDDELGLIAHWTLDETDGDVAHDLRGDANHGTLRGGATWHPQEGIIDGALAFNGIDAYVETPSVVNPADGPFSVLAWINGGASSQVIVSQVGGSNWLMTDPSEGALMTELSPPVGRQKIPPLGSSAVITDGDWHRIAIVWDGVTRALYVDETLVAEDVQTGLAACEGGLNLGCDKDMTPGTFWSGLLDDVRIYNRAVRP